MSNLIDFNQSAEPPKLIEQPKAPINMRPVAVDNNIRPLHTLRGMVEGMPVIVNYYSELTDKRSATHGQDIGKPNTVQQYKKIERMEIRLDGDIDQDQNDETKEFTIRGGAFVTSGVIPEGGDMVVMDVGNGRSGVFQVSNSKRMTALNEAVYRIDFVLKYYTSNQEWFDDLESKVVQRLHFIKDYAQFGKDPVVTTETFNDLKRLADFRRQMISDYLRTFLDRDRMTLLVDYSGAQTIDPYTIMAFRDQVNSGTAPELERVKFFSFVLDDEHQHPTFWQAMAQRRADLLIGCRDRAELVSNTYMSKRPKLNALRWSGISNFIMPTIANDNVARSFRVDETNRVEETPRKGAVSEIIREMVPLHVPNQGGYYILSAAFYNNEECLSVLEKLTMDYLNRKSVDPHVLAWLVSNHASWSRAQKYFFFPIVLALIQSILLDAT